MLGYIFDVNVPLCYGNTGKFEAPSCEWAHAKAPLEDYELIVMSHGVLYISYHNQNYVVWPGQYLLLSPSEDYRMGFRPSDCSFYWMHFSSQRQVEATQFSDEQNGFEPRGKAIFLAEQGALPFPEKVLVLMRQLQDYIRSSYESNAVDYMTTTILCEIYNQSFWDLRQGDIIANSPRKKQIYNDIIDYVKLNVQTDLKITNIANYFGYNEKYLSHLFRSIVGIPLKQYILKLKVEEANFFLTDTNLSIGQISEKLGFSDSHVFAKSYKKVSGLTPTEYRNAFSQRRLFHE